MTLDDVGRLTRYWAQHPPEHIVLALAHGIKPKAAPEAAPQDIGALLAMAPGGLLNIRHLGGL